MIRGIDKWFWPYMTVAVYNEKEKVCIGLALITPAAD
jgi:hypothetical protein